MKRISTEINCLIPGWGSIRVRVEGNQISAHDFELVSTTRTSDEERITLSTFSPTQQKRMVIALRNEAKKPAQQPVPSK